MLQPGISFLDMQDLAAVTAQTGIVPLLEAWWADSEELLGALEIGIAAVGAVVILKRPRNAKGRHKPPAPCAKP
jgi:hypothetical protein